MLTTKSLPIEAGVEYTITHNLGMIAVYTFLDSNNQEADLSVYDIQDGSYKCKSLVAGTLYYVYDNYYSSIMVQETQAIEAGVEYIIEHNLGMIVQPTLLDDTGSIADLSVYDVTTTAFKCKSLIAGTLHYYKSDIAKRVKHILNDTSLNDAQIIEAIDEALIFLDSIFDRVDISDALYRVVTMWYAAHICRVSERELNSQNFDGIAASFSKDEGSFLQKAIEYDTTNTLSAYYRDKKAKYNTKVMAAY